MLSCFNLFDRIAFIVDKMGASRILILLFIFECITIISIIHEKHIFIRDQLQESELRKTFEVHFTSISAAVTFLLAICIPQALELIFDWCCGLRSVIEDELVRIFVLIVIVCPIAVISVVANISSEDLPYIFAASLCIQYSGCFFGILSLCHKLSPQRFSISKIVFVAVMICYSGVATMSGLEGSMFTAINASAFGVSLIVFILWFSFSVGWICGLTTKEIESLCIADITCIFYSTGALVTLIIIPGIAAIFGFGWRNFTAAIICTIIYSLVGFCVIAITLPGRHARYSLNQVSRHCETKEFFMQFLSSELQSPLNVISMGVEVLLDDMNNGEISVEDTHRRLIDIQSSSTAAVGVLEDLLWSESSRSRLSTLSLARMPLLRTLRELFNPWQGIISREKEIAFFLDCRVSSSHLYFLVDVKKMHRVVRNIMNYVLKSSPHEGVVNVSLRYEDKREGDSTTSMWLRSTLARGNPGIATAAVAAVGPPPRTESGRRELGLQYVPTAATSWWCCSCRDRSLARIEQDQTAMKQALLQGLEYCGDVVWDITDSNPGPVPDKLRKLFQEIDTSSRVVDRAVHSEISGDRSDWIGSDWIGLGLRVSREIVRQHDGKISVRDCSSGHGTVFSIRFRCYRKPQHVSISMANDPEAQESFSKFENSRENQSQDYLLLRTHESPTHLSGAKETDLRFPASATSVGRIGRRSGSGSVRGSGSGSGSGSVRGGVSGGWVGLNSDGGGDNDGSHFAPFKKIEESSSHPVEYYDEEPPGLIEGVGVTNPMRISGVEHTLEGSVEALTHGSSKSSLLGLILSKSEQHGQDEEEQQQQRYQTLRRLCIEMGEEPLTGQCSLDIPTHGEGDRTHGMAAQWDPHTVPRVRSGSSEDWAIQVKDFSTRFISDEEQQVVAADSKNFVCSDGDAAATTIDSRQYMDSHSSAHTQPAISDTPRCPVFRPFNTRNTQPLKFLVVDDSRLDRKMLIDLIQRFEITHQKAAVAAASAKNWATVIAAVVGDENKSSGSSQQPVDTHCGTAVGSNSNSPSRGTGSTSALHRSNFDPRTAETSRAGGRTQSFDINTGGTSGSNTMGLRYTILQADDGNIAVDMMRRSLLFEPFDCVFLDKMMTKMDGVEAARIIRADGYTGPIIGVTGNVFPRDLDEFSRSGVDRIVTKPLRMSEMRQVFAWLS